MIDDIEDDDLPKYDEYDDDSIVDFELTYLEQETTFHPSENDCFKQSKENNKPTNSNCDNNGEHEESIKSGEGTYPCVFSHSNY
jgi:hypothetical protein